MTDIAAEIRDILVFHLGVEEGLLTDDARLADDLGADRLDLVEIVMSCEERFDVDIPNHVAAGLATVGDAVHFVQAQLARSTGAGAVRRPVGPRFLVGEALQACARLARRRSADRDVLETRSSSVPAATRASSRGMAMRAILILAVAGLVALVLQPAGAAAESGSIGRTSGPHLHFQVQADSTNWGQSVPIAFGDCEVPAGGATVTSDNANSNFP